MVPNKNNIWWYPGHRRMILPVPYDYKIPPLYYLKGEGKPKEEKIFITPVPVRRPEKTKPAPKTKTLF